MKKATWGAVISVVLAAGLPAFSQVTSTPAAQQPVATNVPAQPASAAQNPGAVQAANQKVVVIPFTQIGNTEGHDWVATAINESMVNQVASTPGIQSIALEQPLAHDTAARAEAVARDNGAKYVVFGAFQYANDQIRVTGQVIDVDTMQVAGTLKATGPLADLFKIEDTLNSQLQAALPQPPSNIPAVTYGADQSAVPSYSAAQAQPDTTYVYPASPQYVAPDYTYPVYTYPYDYGYGYGFPVFIGGGYWGGWRGGWNGGWHGYVGHPWGGGLHGGIGFHGAVGGFHAGGFAGGFHGGGFGGGGHR